MGRAKLALKCIEDDKKRKLTFIRRRDGLKKKIVDFESKCGVETFFIVYDNTSDNGKPMIWPEDPNKALSIIEMYELQKNAKAPKNFHLEDFFEHKIEMAKAEIAKVKKDIVGIKYPTWDPSFSMLEVEQVGSFVALLNAKIQDCNQRINMMRNNCQQSEANFSLTQNMAQMDGANNNIQLQYETDELESWVRMLGEPDDWISQHDILAWDSQPSNEAILDFNGGETSSHSSQWGIPTGSQLPLPPLPNHNGTHIDPVMIVDQGEISSLPSFMC